MTVAQKIAREIRAAIHASENGSGRYVFAQDKNTRQHRIYQVRANGDTVQGRTLSTGTWFTISGWEAR